MERTRDEFLDASARLLETLNKLLTDQDQLTLFDFMVLDMLAKGAGGSARMGDLAHELVVGSSRVDSADSSPGVY